MRDLNSCLANLVDSLMVRLGTTHILRLKTLRSFFHLKLHLGAFLEGPVSGHLNGRKVDKYIFTAGSLDKSIALGGVEPFHYTLFSHYWYLLFHSRLRGTFFFRRPRPAPTARSRRPSRR